ncbi:hypothetical protein [Marinobacterium aestuariivivens]|uniref:Uncharacterized protein n=1 Tax=Marinobacterium aestuariivivens TaxID=1698799 RepID=A0ABW2A778_9GAMM
MPGHRIGDEALSQPAVTDHFGGIGQVGGILPGQDLHRLAARKAVAGHRRKRVVALQGREKLDEAERMNAGARGLYRNVCLREAEKTAQCQSGNQGSHGSPP